MYNTKNSETPIERTQTKPQETLGFKLTQPKNTSSFTPSIKLGLDCKWIIGWTKLENYKFVFKQTEEKIKLKLNTFPDLKKSGIF